MKKISLLFFVTGIFIFQSAQAQFRMRPRYRRRVPENIQQPYFKPELNLSIGYGYPNLDKNALLDFYQAYRGSGTQQGPVFGALDYRINRGTGIGLMFSYGKVDAPYYNYNSTATAPPAFTGHLENKSVLLNLMRYMPVSTAVTPYVRTAFGINIWSQSYVDATGNKVITALPDPPAFAYQAGIGAKFNFGKHAGAFVEAGYGKYIVSAGLSFKLN
jgi:hypothetical protein